MTSASAANSISLCVYCGSRSGTEAAYQHAAHEVGTLIGRLGWQLVYGGGRAGLMGIVADAALSAGATVIGVIPASLMVRELGHPGLAELHVVQTMHERKRLMAERANAFLALPGGLGTLEEMFEAWTWRQLGYHDKPLGLLNVDGYYDALLHFIGQTLDRGFISAVQKDLLEVDVSPAPLLQRLGDLARRATVSDDYQRI